MTPDALAIPPPSAAVIEPGVLASYGAVMAAALLGVLYVYRGRGFVVYWIISWLLLAGALHLASLGYAASPVGHITAGAVQLLGFWSAGLLLLAAQAFPDQPPRWTTPLKAAAASALWFLVAPLALPLSVTLVTGAAAIAVLMTWVSVTYLDMFKRTRHAGSLTVGIGTALLAASSLVMTSAVAIEAAALPALQNRATALNAVVNIFVAFGMHLLAFEDMTGELQRTNRDLAAAHAEVQRLAITDTLTGCYNRRFFEQIEARELQRHHRYGSPLSVMFVDVNRLKQLNDTRGHEAGDAALRGIGALLRRHLRASDYVIRWGGDEFLLLLTCGLAQAQQKAAELKIAFAADLAATQLPSDVGLSAGVAEVASDASTLNDALRLADERMYDDKFSARARIAT